jgi:ribosomal protein S18 acetylase RimI-like enzyme
LIPEAGEQYAPTPRVRHYRLGVVVHASPPLDVGAPDEVVEIRRLGEHDVPALIACTRRCYGESYPESDLYEPSYIRSELRARRLLSVGAVVGSRVVGHVGTRIPIPGDAVAETIAGIIDPDYRGMGLTSRMGGQMVADYRDLGIVATRHIATGAPRSHTAHHRIVRRCRHRRAARPYPGRNGLPRPSASWSASAWRVA